MTSSFSLVLVVALLASPFFVSGLELNWGNEELKAAMDRAAVLAYHDGDWVDTIGKEKGASLPFLCGDWKTLSLYPQPELDNITADGALDDVLQTQVLKAAYVKTKISLEKYDGTQYVALDTTNASDVTGAFAEWHDALVDQLNIMYNKTIAIRYVIHDSPTEALRAVSNGDAHLAITPFKTDLTYNGVPRVWAFLSGCPDNGVTFGELYQDKDVRRFTSYSQVMENGRRIGTLNSKCNMYKMIFVNSEVVCTDDTVKLRQDLRTGDLDAISEKIDDTTPIPGVLPSSAFGSYYRRDDPCAPVNLPSSGEKMAVWGGLLAVVLGLGLVL